MRFKLDTGIASLPICDACIVLMLIHCLTVYIAHIYDTWSSAQTEELLSEFIYFFIVVFVNFTAWAGFCQWSNNNQQRGNKWSGALSEKIVYKGGPSGLMLLSADSHMENSLNSKQSWGTTIILEQQDAVKIPND